MLFANVQSSAPCCLQEITHFLFFFKLEQHPPSAGGTVQDPPCVYQTVLHRSFLYLILIVRSDFYIRPGEVDDN